MGNAKAFAAATKFKVSWKTGKSGGLKSKEFGNKGSFDRFFTSKRSEYYVKSEYLDGRTWKFIEEHYNF